jgi:hypothetical protein
MTFEYQIIYTTGVKPDLIEVNNMALDGWEFVQMGQSTSQQLTGQWYYLLKRKLTPSPEPAPSQ